jgi:hypothetical protein
VIWKGRLMTSFQMMGSPHINLDLDGYPDVGKTNEFFEQMKGKKIKVAVEAC